jgi:hypothetical protein
MRRLTAKSPERKKAKKEWFGMHRTIGYKSGETWFLHVKWRAIKGQIAYWRLEEEDMKSDV